MFSEGIDDTWVEVGRFAAVGEAEQHALVLVATGVASRLAAHSGGVSLLVALPDAIKARSEIAAYTSENRPPTAAPALRPVREGLDAALIYCSVLILVHAAATQGAFALDWLGYGAADAGLIRAGEWWRSITALGLHADFGHLLSNLVLGSILGILLAQLLGGGLAWLAILAAGGVGNAVTSFFHPENYVSIGASTAVFAALGLLAALAWRQRAALWWGWRRWLPIAAALMLLAMLGVGGERTDVGAHVAGLATGFVAGAGLYIAGSRVPQGLRAQLIYGAMALALFAGAWLAAFTSI